MDEEKCLCPYSRYMECINCKIKYHKRRMKEANEDLLYANKKFPLIFHVLTISKEEARLIYQIVYDDCIKNHKNPWSYYQRGLLYFEQESLRSL